MTIPAPPRPDAEVLREYPTFQSVQNPRGFKTVANVLLALLVIIAGTLILVPWQQSIYGIGEVTVFSPMDRPQTIQAQIDGQIEHWYVEEGDAVKQGDLLVRLRDIDPKFLDPQQLERLQEQRLALQARQSATIHRINALRSQISALAQSQGAAIPSAGIRTAQALNRIEAARQTVTAAEQDLTTARLNFERMVELQQRGLRSMRDQELAEQALVQARTRLEQAEVALMVTQQEQNVAGWQQTQVAADTEASLKSAQAALATAEEALAVTNSDLARLDVDISAVEQRITQRMVRAPRDGIVVRVLNYGPGEAVRPGETLAIVAPETADQAVALYVSHHDAPLVSVGRPVRLQFAGWPAIQFAGWPSVAVGTFAGRVAVVDAIADDTTSRYRILIRPDYEAIEEGREQTWPSSRYLRPGTDTGGWVMLDTVPLWFELWRQFNAFPPTIQNGPMTELEKNTLEQGARSRKR